MKKDYNPVKIAKDYEKSAKRHEKGKLWYGGSVLGRAKDLHPYNIGNEYSAAARNWIKAKETKKAYGDYVKASEFYLKEAEGHKRYAETQNIISGGYGIRYKNSMKASKEAQKQAERLKRVLGGKWHGLEGKIVATILTIGFFALSIFFINPNLSGKVISNLNQTASGIIGAVFFVLGLIGIFSVVNFYSDKL